MGELNMKQEEVQEVTFSDVVWEQIFLLADWNKENFNNDPEQARKNLETILQAKDSL